MGDNNFTIDYELAYPGKVLPDSVFWPLKVVRDRLWLFATTGDLKKAELKLLFADKRIGGAKILFSNGKNEIAYSTLTKAEKYLEEAYLAEEGVRKSGVDTKEFSTRLSKAALKHYQVMDEILEIAPDDAKPGIRSIQDIPKTCYQRSMNSLLEQGLTAPENPYNWQ